MQGLKNKSCRFVGAFLDILKDKMIKQINGQMFAVFGIFAFYFKYIIYQYYILYEEKYSYQKCNYMHRIRICHSTQTSFLAETFSTKTRKL